jgi:hypothetical protein
MGGAVLIPPPEYDHEPPMRVVEMVMEWTEVWALCGAWKAPGFGFPIDAKKDHSGIGCSFVNVMDGKCWIIRVDNPMTARHERAHCNGWASNHPGARTTEDVAPPAEEKKAPWAYSPDRLPSLFSTPGDPRVAPEPMPITAGPGGWAGPVSRGAR